MQFKTLVLVAVAAAAAVSAQMFEDTPCTRCVFRSYRQDSSCRTLSAEDLAALDAAITPTGIVPALLARAVQKPAAKACVCHWAITAFTTGGAASSCTTGNPPICNASQRDQISYGFKNLVPLLNCGAAPAPRRR